MAQVYTTQCAFDINIGKQLRNIGRSHPEALMSSAVNAFMAMLTSVIARSFGAVTTTSSRVCAVTVVASELNTTLKPNDVLNSCFI